MSKVKKYCEGLDCAICDEKEPCIYKIANELQEQLKRKEQECERWNKLINDLQDSCKYAKQLGICFNPDWLSAKIDEVSNV